MTPYGIVYREDPFLYEKSVETAEKKCGFLRINKILKFCFPIFALATVLFTAAGIIMKDNIYFMCFVIQCAVTVFFVRANVKRAEVKNKARVSVTKTPVQIVFYENCFVATLPYSQTEFSYDEVAFCEENQGLLTLVIKNNISVFSIPCSMIIKGNYYNVCSILKGKLVNRFICKGGR